ncbi:MAG: hypothetical protein WDZ35_03565, partial [Crocinitomicaceae bacterium]
MKCINQSTFLLFVLLILPSFASAMPGGGGGTPCVIGAANDLGVVNGSDDCFGATSLGALDAPCACDGATITPTQISGTTIGATAENPYVSITACGGTGNDQASPAADVWYTVDVTGNELNIDITSSFNQTNVAIYTDDGGGCGGLIPLGCWQENGGTLSTTFENVSSGTTVYIQVSGEDDTDVSNFDMTISNDVSCDDCILQDNLTVSPAPVNGTYQAGETVTFCYSINEFSQENANWLHGIVPNFGAGWDMGTFTIISEPPNGSCGTGCNGDWDWYTNLNTNQGNLTGWFFDDGDGDPTDNFGDNLDGTGNPLWEWCFSITTVDCVEGADLSISIDNYADGETGSWTDVACDNDPSYAFSAALTCCPFPDTISVPESCIGACDGSATVTGNGASPWDYVWEDASGNVIANQNNVNGSSTQNGLCAGTYTVSVTDNNGCVKVTDVTVGIGSCPVPAFDPEPADATVQCTAPAMTDLNWTDPCGSIGTVTGVDASDGNTCPEVITRTWTYTNVCGNTTTATQTITVDDTQNPTGTAPANVTVQCIADVPAINVTAITDEADNCTVNPTVTHISDVSDNNTCPETITRTYRITDDCNNFIDVTQTITVDDTQNPT